MEVKALAERELGKYVLAEQTLRSVIALAPDRRWPYGDLSRLLLQIGRRADAEIVARQALDVDPRNADAHAILGSIFAEKEHWFEAATHFKLAIASTGAHPRLLAGLGHATLRLGQLNEAREVLEAATAADPQALEPRVYLAEIEERVGAFEEAARLLASAEPIAQRQGSDVDLQRSALLERMGKSDQALTLLESKGEISGAALLQRGRLRERARRFDDAWNDWTSGKARLAERAGRSYAAEWVEAEAEKLIAIASGATELSPAAKCNDLPQPIFIVGFPRSGTTLTEQILASHSVIRAG